MPDETNNPCPLAWLARKYFAVSWQGIQGPKMLQQSRWDPSRPHGANPQIWSAAEAAGREAARHGTTGPSSEVSHGCSGAGPLQAPASRTGALGGTGLELGALSW